MRYQDHPNSKPHQRTEPMSGSEALTWLQGIVRGRRAMHKEIMDELASIKPEDMDSGTDALTQKEQLIFKSAIHYACSRILKNVKE